MGRELRDELRDLKEMMLKELRSAVDADGVNHVVGRYRGRSGGITRIANNIGTLPLEDRKKIGAMLKEIQSELDDAVERRRADVDTPASSSDPTLPGERPSRGHLHPLTRYSRRMLGVFRSFGYDVHEGPELEQDWFNFEALNFPKDHPSRDIQDTFFIKDRPNLVLRTHTSTVQLRSVMFHRKPPMKCIEIGRVYRHEATDAKHESMFTQCDGIAIDRHLTMAHLVGTLRFFLRAMFGPHAVIRVRPSYFPFVEPGIEIDMQWKVNGRTEWLEMLGAGMVHPNVLKSMKLDPNAWRGFAFGMGVDRLMMLDTGVNDIRLSYSGNLEFLKQF